MLAAELALPHRLKRGPMADGQMNMGALQATMEQANAEFSDEGEAAEAGEAGDQETVKKKVLR